MPSAHLAFLLASLAMGGAERAILTVAGEASRRGHRVDLVLAKKKGDLLSEVPEGVRVVEIGKLPRVLALPALFRSRASTSLCLSRMLFGDLPGILRSLPRLNRYLRENQPDALLSTLPANNLTAIWAKRLGGVRTKIVIREASTLSLHHANAHDGFDTELPSIVRRWYPEADEIVAVSKGVAEDLASFAGIDDGRITTIYNPVRLKQIEELAGLPLDDPWLSGDLPVVVSVGRLDAAKDYPTLLKAFAKVLAERPCRLLVLGEGNLRPRLLEIRESLGLQSAVRFLGTVNNPFRYLKRADLFVLSSAWEGFPNALLEAMACGTPVVSTDCRCGPREILDHGRYGTLVPVGNAEALAQEMLSSLGCQRFSKEDMRHRVLDFSESRITADYLDLLLSGAGVGRAGDMGSAQEARTG